MVASDERAERAGLRPLARVVAYHTGGMDPADIMEAPIPTVRALFEEDRAWAWTTSTSSSTTRRTPLPPSSSGTSWDIPEEKFNVNGGAVALGHPIGCERREGPDDPDLRAEEEGEEDGASRPSASAAGTPSL